MNAQIGDDVFGEDTAINELEAKVAKLFGHEAGLFCPSGTMTNQIAIAVHTSPRDEVICHQHSHIYLYEGGGPAFHSGVSLRLLPGDRGLLTAEAIEEAINPDNVHFPRTTLVSLENTMNKGGGACYDLSELQAIKQVCTKNGLKLHLDGARIFNAIVAKGYSAADIGSVFDSISVCLSKGLGAPVGSVLIGTKAFINEARRVRKVFGGGMRQAGFLAAAGTYALDHHVERLADDHQKAKEAAQALASNPHVASVYPVETNVVIFEPKDPFTVNDVLPKLNQSGILATGFGKKAVRLVYHLDISDEMHQTVLKTISSISFG